MRDLYAAVGAAGVPLWPSSCASGPRFLVTPRATYVTKHRSTGRVAALGGSTAPVGNTPEMIRYAGKAFRLDTQGGIATAGSRWRVTRTVSLACACCGEP